MSSQFIPDMNIKDIWGENGIEVRRNGGNVTISHNKWENAVINNRITGLEGKLKGLEDLINSQAQLIEDLRDELSLLKEDIKELYE